MATSPPLASQGRRRVRAVELDLRSWRGVVLRVASTSVGDRITTSAASLAFHSLLAIFPAVIALLGVAGLVGLTSTQLTAVVRDVGVLLPAAASQVLVSALRQHLSGGANGAEVALGSLVAIWSAIEAMASLEVGLDVAFGVTVDRGFLRRRLMALPLLGLTAGLGGVAFALVVLGRPLSELLRRSVPVVGGEFVLISDLVRFVGAIAALSLLLSAYYAVGPNRSRRRWDWCSPGSVVAVVAWLAASLGYSGYLDGIGHASRTYGSFAGVAVLMLWLFVSALAVLAGAELDGELERLAEKRSSNPSGEETEA